MPKNTIPASPCAHRTDHAESQKSINRLCRVGGVVVGALLMGGGIAVCMTSSQKNNHRTGGNNQNRTNGTGSNGNNKTDVGFQGNNASLAKSHGRRDAGPVKKPESFSGYSSDKWRDYGHQFRGKKNSVPRLQLSQQKAFSNSTEAKNSHGGLQQSRVRGKNGQTSSREEKNSLTTIHNKNNSAENSSEPNLRNLQPGLRVSDRQPGANKTSNTSHSVLSRNGKGSNNAQLVEIQHGKELKTNDTHTRSKRDAGVFVAAPVDTLEGGAAFLFGWDSALQQEGAVSSPTVSQPRSSVVETNVRIPQPSLSFSQLNQQILDRNSSIIQFARLNDPTIFSGGNTTASPVNATTPEEKQILMLKQLERCVGERGMEDGQISSTALNKLKQFASESQLSMTDLFRYAAGMSHAKLTGKDPFTLSNAELDNLVGPFVESVFFQPEFIAKIVEKAANGTLSFSEIKQEVSAQCQSYPHVMLGQFNVAHFRATYDALHSSLTDSILSGVSPLFLRNDVEEIGDIKLGSLEHLVTEMGHLQDQDEGL